MTEPLDLEPIKARLAAATPGPWESDIYPGSENWVYVGGVRGPGPSLELGADSSGDAEFITNAPTDIDALVTEVERLRYVATELAKEYIDEFGRHDRSRPYDENVEDLVNATPEEFDRL